MSVTAQQTQVPVASGSPFIASSPSSRQYQSPANVDTPRTQTTTRQAGSPHSSRRPSRKQSGNTNKVNSSDPAGSQRSASSTPRVQELPRATRASPAAVFTASSPAPSPLVPQAQSRDQRDQPSGPPLYHLQGRPQIRGINHQVHPLPPHSLTALYLLKHLRALRLRPDRSTIHLHHPSVTEETRKRSMTVSIDLEWHMATIISQIP